MNLIKKHKILFSSLLSLSLIIFSLFAVSKKAEALALLNPSYGMEIMEVDYTKCCNGIYLRLQDNKGASPVKYATVVMNWYDIYLVQKLDYMLQQKSISLGKFTPKIAYCITDSSECESNQNVDYTYYPEIGDQEGTAVPTQGAGGQI